MGVDDAISPPAWRIRRFATLDSTNRYLLDEARAGAPAGLVAVADHQSAGRGRLGRAWEAPAGSALLVSVLLRPRLAAGRLALLTMAAGLALAEAVGQVTGVEPALKWPNDLVVADRKLAGLLAEADLEADGAVRAVVVGAGCNVHALPPGLAGPATSCDREAGRHVSRADLLSAYLDRLAARAAAADAVVADYRARLDTLGRRVRVDLGDRVLEGVAAAVGDDGRLLVETADGPVAVAAGDVVHLRAVGPGAEHGDPAAP